MSRSPWLALLFAGGLCGLLGKSQAVDLASVSIADPATLMQEELRRAERAAPPLVQPSRREAA